MRRVSAPPRIRALPGTIWALGATSLFMDLSSELVHSLLPVFLTTVLGAGMIAVGLVEGIAEATASVVKVFSGVLSDRLGRRKPLVLLGYGLAALSKPLFPLAGSVALVLAARFMDRVGKGIRGAPRDALIADVAPPELRGAAYGLRQALDTAGAVLGPLAAIGLMLWLASDIRSVLWAAVVPAVVAVLVLAVWVKEPEDAHAPRPAANPVSLDSLRQFGPRLWLIVALGAVLTLARFSEAFLVLRALDLGLALALVPAVLVVMNLIYTAVAYPAGIAADRGGRRALLFWGLAALIVSNLVLGAATSIGAMLAGVALWGLHMGLTQGLLATLVADAAPARLRGTAFGVFHLVSGGALLAASVIAGVLWSALGASFTFYAGAAFTAVALAGLLLAAPARS
ncbi:MAG: MFS transporter [Betaproteobacteria bacterium RIFCSPHIGHO2_12_FULL_69_13]|nr:MAG: MFS transporter [Betaproteobacteria bacterium RIFCSPHIGHO2_12_FULL_69_13]